MDISKLTKEERRELLEQLRRTERADEQVRKEAYEGLREAFMRDVWDHLHPVTNDVAYFREWLEGECKAFRETMREYGKLRRGEGQESYTIVEGDFKMEVRSNKVKAFDERADLAAERLVNYLKAYVGRTEKGTEDPMYQLAMTLLERNKQGDLDYKSVSKLYELEGRFDDEYAEIMRLFKESNVVYKTATNYYFSGRDPETGVWKHVEPSFCRL
ncbi:MAG: DUF3164 family protein [Mediterranea sp.]|jgi:hypothetical protein|nr:DUF3164 family protein [Mediterranea sp.]